MAEFRPGSADQDELRQDLLSHGILVASGVAGLYGHSATFDDIVTALDRMVTAAAAGDRPERFRFPPLLPRAYLERNNYLESFPHLAGTVFSFDGGNDEASEQAARATRGEDWSEFQRITDLVLTPAACYPAYPAMGARGPLPEGGVTLDLGAAWVFRHEPAGDPARMQSFHQREVVRLGAPDEVCAWRDTWRDRAAALLGSLGLNPKVDVATDPFFGRGARMLAASQRQQQLKFEILVEITDPEPTAVASFNYHQEHFAHTYGITTFDGATAHTACLGFGLERITIALLRTHGFDPTAWPAPVREVLWP